MFSCVILMKDKNSKEENVQWQILYDTLVAIWGTNV